jgi:hypothetical protein
MKYQIIVASNPAQLAKMVTTELKYGWGVTGGLAVYMIESPEMLHPKEPVFLQAMIHPDEYDNV